MVKQESLASDEDGEDGQFRKRMKDDGNLSDFHRPSQTIYQKSLIQVVIPSASASINNRAVESMLPTQSDRHSNMSKGRQSISKPLQLTPEECFLVQRLNHLAKGTRTAPFRKQNSGQKLILASQLHERYLSFEKLGQPEQKTTGSRPTYTVKVLAS
jgi:hypothetical protein